MMCRLKPPETQSVRMDEACLRASMMAAARVGRRRIVLWWKGVVESPCRRKGVRKRRMGQKGG